MPSNLLILAPADSNAGIDTASIVTELRRIGLAGESFEFQGGEHLRPGGRFLELVTFLGCSPVVSLGEPGLTGSEFCHLAVEPPSAQARFLFGDNVKQPRCPACRARVEPWRPLVEELGNGSVPVWDCPRCGEQHPAERLDWRQSAGAARQFIRVFGIFEGEAVPGDELLRALAEASGGPWRHFYLRL